MLNLLIAFMIYGSVSNLYGQIGIYVGSDGGIGKVYGNSPAQEAGLERGDRILSADGKDGISRIDGDANTWVTIKVKKAKTKKIETLTIMRVTPEGFIKN